MAASPQDWGQNGDARFIAAGEVRSISTTRLLKDAIARFEARQNAATA